MTGKWNRRTNFGLDTVYDILLFFQFMINYSIFPLRHLLSGKTLNIRIMRWNSQCSLDLWNKWSGKFVADFRFLLFIFSFIFIFSILKIAENFKYFSLKNHAALELTLPRFLQDPALEMIVGLMSQVSILVLGALWNRYPQIHFRRTWEV